MCCSAAALLLFCVVEVFNKINISSHIIMPHMDMMITIYDNLCIIICVVAIFSNTSSAQPGLVNSWPVHFPLNFLSR